MSQSLIKARKRLGQVSTHLKQGKYMPAAQSISDAIVLVLKTGVMKNEKEEFQEMFEKAVYALNNNKPFREMYPLIVNYKMGEEKALHAEMQNVLKTLQEHINESARADAEELENLKSNKLEEGQGHLDNKEHDDARSVFDGLLDKFKSDTDLKADIADRYLRAGLYDDALSLLEDALKHDPQAIFLYNRIGIVLRKMGKFDTAEKYYLKAIEICQTDEYLYFNFGRLYYDWKKWDKMLDAAEKALEINPEFAEAAKMKAFAAKKL